VEEPRPEEVEVEHRQVEEEAVARRHQVVAAEGERRTRHREEVRKWSRSPYRVHLELRRGHQGRPQPKGGHRWLVGEAGVEYHRRTASMAQLILLQGR